MTDNQRRHERKPVNEPASVKSGNDSIDGTLTDVSLSGAAVEFTMGESHTPFDIGSNVEVDADALKNRKGRVVRHYDKGFAVNFEGEG